MNRIIEHLKFQHDDALAHDEVYFTRCVCGAPLKLWIVEATQRIRVTCDDGHFLETYRIVEEQPRT